MDSTPYLRTAGRRVQAERRALTERRQLAWQLARLPRERYSARCVVLFGSLVHGGGFRPGLT